MDFYLIGTDYRCVDIALREEFYRKRREIFDSWGKIFRETAVLSTCNRLEVYGLDKKSTELPQVPAGWYFIHGKVKIFRHALRLATGLESQLKGELQILEQINSWKSNLQTGLSTIWEKAYFEALDIRNQTGLNRDEYNIATLLYQDLQKYSLDHKEPQILIMGTGKIAGLLAKHKPGNARLVFAAHKNKNRAEELAVKAKGQAIDFKDLNYFLGKADFLISATASPHFILNKDKVLPIASQRDKPLYIYDLAIPRDIEPGVGAIKGVVLKNIEDFSLSFQENNKNIQPRLNLAEYLVEERVKEYEKSIKDREPSEPLSYKTS